MEQFIVGQDAAGPSAAVTYMLFIIAGLLVGGTWSAYQAGMRIGTVVMGLLAVVATAGAILWLLGAFT
ncbi:non-structural protein NS4A [Corynebacterium sp. TAE3-ERU12]|uniref:non-structural protein NS4A n=1 Tax=Corynebacterium sp. TAE3-ERU12 TaxID=2849491 RepID=UPI001C481B8B|nr:non-structural protein NS4A [Corynebacterium sp. TAE3-ERU12]MBV7296177.1 non-structural protein NS4A [Corynebacterium sp. TAE3-ERU12]